METEPREARGEDPALLFEEYIRLHDEGENPDTSAFVQRAGAQAESFRKRIALLDDVDDLFRALEDTSEIEEPDLQNLGRYKILRTLGEGGLSRVYLAVDPSLGREVALKILQPGAVSLIDARQWMLSEGRSLAKLHHESIVRVYEIDECDGFAYVAMECVHGPSLAETMDALRGLDPLEVDDDTGVITSASNLEPISARCRLIARAARALAYCHEQGIVHRDVKPGNILLDSSRNPKLIDFGLAHLEDNADASFATQRLMGTPAYLAPEQVEENKTGASFASDQFSLGVVFYEILTLQRPFVGRKRSDVMSAIARAQPAPPRKINAAIPADVERICMHCLELDPEDRYGNIEELADDLDAFLEHRAISLQPPSPTKLAHLWFRRNRRMAVSSIVALAILFAATAATWLLSERAARDEILTWAGRTNRNMAAIQEPFEFVQLFKQLIQYKEPAGRFDEALLSGFLLQPTGSALAATQELAIKNFHRASNDYIAKTGSPLFDEPVEWVPIRNLMKAMISASDTEIVKIPERGELFRFEFDHWADPPRTSFVPVPDHSFLAPGFYRFVDRRSDVREREFEVREGPSWKLEVTELDAGMRRRLTSYESPGVPRFHLSDPITWREAGESLGECVTELLDQMKMARHVRNKPLLGLSEDDPASMPWKYAQAYVDHVGGRLPTPEELAVVLCSETERPASRTTEWTSALMGKRGSGQVHLAMRYEEVDCGSEIEGHWLEDHRAGDGVEDSCFRVAISD